MQLKAFVFDLGNVIFNFNISKFLIPLSQKSHASHISKNAVEYSEIFESFETGKISPEEFYKFIVGKTAYSGSYEEFCYIWNNIFDVPNRKTIDIIISLKKRYPIALLSNTNPLHYEFKKKEHPEIFSLFDKTYLSYKIGLRKPDPEIYQKMISDLGFNPQEIFFTDDLHENVAAARTCAIKSYQFINSSKLKSDLEFEGVKL